MRDWTLNNYRKFNAPWTMPLNPCVATAALLVALRLCTIFGNAQAAKRGTVILHEELKNCDEALYP